MLLVRMRRITISVCALALAGISATVAPAARTPGKPRAPASVKVADCRAPEERSQEGSAEFFGRMGAVPGAKRMEMRFALLERLGPRSFARVKVPGLDAWRKSRRGAASFGYTQKVAELRRGGAYRALVRFRWYGADGKLVLRAARRSGICRQPGEPPNLRPGRITVLPGPVAGTAVYAVGVVNSGGSVARKISVVLAVDGAALDAIEIEALAARASRTVQFTGPVCDKGLRATVDPDDKIRELDEDDNVRTRSCR